MKRFALSAIEEAKQEGSHEVSAAIKKAGNMTSDNLKNAERDLHILFRKYGLTIPVQLSTLKCGLFHLHYISLQSWFAFLFGDYSHLLLGGFNIDDPLSTLLLKSFWQKYRDANGDHWVYSEHADNLGKCVPYYLHLDEGTSLRKSSVLVFNMQAAWGTQTKTDFERLWSAGTGRSDADMENYMLEGQCHNQRGSSLMSRFLYTLIPKKWYTKKNDFVYDKVLGHIAAESQRLASKGVRGMFPICLGIKGDAPALAKAGHFTRSFLNLVFTGVYLDLLDINIFGFIGYQYFVHCFHFGGTKISKIC